ncbi:MAG: PKD domain-containing protein [Runella slithyformis]|nr:MAG: PKD domain-containing protein [Runella slithyformis]
MLRFISRLLILVVLLVANAAQAQRNEPCATMEMDSLLRLKHPELGTLDQFERALQKKIIAIKVRQAASREVAEVVTLPVVVHIVHNGEAIGQGRNLSEAQVKAQIETLNEDFRRKRGSRGDNQDPRGADIEIEFCLAQVNPNGQRMAEFGIDRISGGRPNWTRNDIENDLKPRTIWDPNKYYNIWVVDFASIEGGLLAYAQFPSQSGLPGINDNSGAANTDGVAIRFTSFGNAEKGTFPVMIAPYNLGRTLAHETGHWLGLRHIWGDGNCGNDFVDDTPTQASSSSGCQKGRMSCGTANMVENYMDYSEDACFNIFTIGQKSRMRAVMELSPRRNSLITANLCGTTVVARPTANFQAENRTVLLGGQVRFTDISSNFPTRWQWEFEGGEPATSTEQNPVVTYRNAGKFKVTLTASNSVGASALATKTAYVEVLNQGLCADVTNFSGTPTLLRQTPGSGYVAGQNSRRTRAVSEFFGNSLGYSNLRGATLRFGVAKAALGRNSESVVRVTAWNARGFQNGPGAVLETKEVPLRQIIDDVAANRPTSVTFDRNLPISIKDVGGLPFHIGIEFDFVAGDTVALITSKDGESTNATSWEQSATGAWDRYIVSNGLNIAHAITAQVGMKTSVQISNRTAQFIDPGQAVILQATGAGVYAWSPNEALNTTLGPQVTATPSRTITYAVKGSGADVCIDSAKTTIYVRNVQILSTNNPIDKNLTVSPNPTDGQLEITLNNELRGAVQIKLIGLTGSELKQGNYRKIEDTFRQSFPIQNTPPGTYFIEVQMQDFVARKRIVKY